MTFTNKKIYPINRQLNILFGFLQSGLVIINGLTENWIKVSDPIANLIYFNILIPASFSIGVLAIFLAVKKSERPFFVWSRLFLNVMMTIAIVFFSIQLARNF